MIVIPKEKPVHAQLNSYYLHFDKFLEFYKKELGSGCLHFTSPSATGVVFFDTDDILQTIYQDKNGKISLADEAFNILTTSAQEQNYQVDLYKIDLSHIYSWLNLHEAPVLEKDIKSNSFSFDDLLQKLESQKLNGFVEVELEDEEGMLIYQEGQVTCGSYSWGDGTIETDQENFELLKEKIKNTSLVYQLYGTIASPEKFFDVDNNVKDKIDKAPSSTIATLEELLDIFERVINTEAELDIDFDMLLKDKFVKKADYYSFLDPFAGEFTYSRQRIKYTGSASEDELTTGITECVRELADELGVLHILKKEIANWSTYLGDDIAHISNKFL